MLIYSGCRVIFLLFNPALAENHSLSELIVVMLAGLRFDAFSVIIMNTLIIFMHFLPAGIFNRPLFQRTLKSVFYLCNIPAILFNLIDSIYFSYTRKRTTSDFFTSEMATDLRFNIASYLSDFWYMLLILAVLLIIIEILYRKVKTIKPDNWYIYLTGVVITLFLSVIGIRGGLQFKPISMQSAARYASQELIPAVLNTPFSIIKTRDQEKLPETIFMDQKKADQLFPVVQKFQHDSLHKMNVVILIMESFSKEYCGFLNNGNGYTQFLDSLSRSALVYINSFANSKRSIEGIPAIVASMPHLMDESFISSAYNTNYISAIAHLLKPYNYTSYFFHGGHNGTMGFENFSSLAGYQKYYGMNEYDGPQSDYDGNWGIYDEPFFMFMKRKLDTTKEPFTSAFFSLSSHHPYTIPANLRNQFQKGRNPVYESIEYADYALKQFFMEAQKSSWYNNTLFIITADHTGPALTTEATTSKGAFEIPLIFYAPSDTLLKGIRSDVAQHIDIVPTILDYLHFNKTFSAFGHSLLSDNNRFAITYINNIYQGIDSNYVLLMDGETGNSMGYYNYRKDPLLQNKMDTLNSVTSNLHEQTQAALQQYRLHLKNNDLK